MDETYKTLLNEWTHKKLPLVIKRNRNLAGYAFIKPSKIIVVSGFRRTGKTFLLFHLAEKLLQTRSRKQVVYINFEDERIPLKTEFLTGLLPAIKQLFGQPEFLFLDEVHNIPLWSKWLRRVYDNENIRFFVTGSSSKMSSREIPTELRGRFLELEVFPLDFQEFCAFKNISISKDYSEDEKASYMNAFGEYLEYGGLPEVVLAPEEKKVEILRGYYNTVIRRDIIERFRIRSEENLKALLRILLNSTQYTISKLYNSLKSLQYSVGKSTIQTFLGYIESAYFIQSVPILSPKVKDQQQWPRKIYFVDTGFVSQLSNKFSRNMGRLYENFVFLELKRRIADDPRKEIFYWMNQRHEEVDFVIKQGTKVMQLIQVCYAIDDYDTKRRELRALVKASRELKCTNLLILTEDKDGEIVVDKKKIRLCSLWEWACAPCGRL